MKKAPFGSYIIAEEITNSGDRVLRHVELLLEDLGIDGKVVYSKKCYPISGSILRGSPARLLKPGETATFGIKIDDPPPTWTSQVRADITNVIFVCHP